MCGTGKGESMAREKGLFFWIVACEGHTDAWVNAADWEQATVAAAGFWGAPWREVAAKCECRQKRPIVKGVCPQCGKFFFGGAKRCDLCEKKARDDERNLQQYLKNRYKHKKQERGGKIADQ
ncbi:hypothetical protein OBV_24040 [Oscillibacter valericigenes Sjm18-20]|nr:hypothetical protein OBV_24040 [Oscillibacter valericigenes Sjm18-20]